MKHYSLIGIGIYFSSWVGVALLGLAYCDWHEVAYTVVLMPLISLAVGTAIVLFLKFVLKKSGDWPVSTAPASSSRCGGPCSGSSPFRPSRLLCCIFCMGTRKTTICWD